MLLMILTINSEYFSKQHLQDVFEILACVFCKSGNYFLNIIIENR
jgi:hypothetical protein